MLYSRGVFPLHEIQTSNASGFCATNSWISHLTFSQLPDIYQLEFACKLMAGSCLIFYFCFVFFFYSKPQNYAPLHINIYIYSTKKIYMKGTSIYLYKCEHTAVTTLFNWSFLVFERFIFYWKKFIGGREIVFYGQIRNIMDVRNDRNGINNTFLSCDRLLSYLTKQKKTWSDDRHAISNIILFILNNSIIKLLRVRPTVCNTIQSFQSFSSLHHFHSYSYVKISSCWYCILRNALFFSLLSNLLLTLFVVFESNIMVYSYRYRLCDISILSIP